MRTYLKVKHHLAHSISHEPGLRNVPYDGWRQTKQYDEEIGHGQVYDEYVCHCTHCVVRIYRNTY